MPLCCVLNLFSAPLVFHAKSLLRMRSCRHGTEPLPSMSWYLTLSAMLTGFRQQNMIFTCIVNSVVAEFLPCLEA